MLYSVLLLSAKSTSTGDVSTPEDPVQIHIISYLNLEASYCTVSIGFKIMFVSH